MENIMIFSRKILSFAFAGAVTFFVAAPSAGNAGTITPVVRTVSVASENSNFVTDVSAARRRNARRGGPPRRAFDSIDAPAYAPTYQVPSYDGGGFGNGVHDNSGPRSSG
jgi:hypothetical protein